jgi:hypothetical protein
MGEHSARMGKMRKAYSILFGKRERGRPFYMPNCRLKIIVPCRTVTMQRPRGKQICTRAFYRQRLGKYVPAATDTKANMVQQ